MATGSFVPWRRDSDEISLVEGDHIERQIAQKQDEHLLPLKEDVAEWIGKTLDMTGLCVDNFMESLETGVLLCRLARIIQQKAEECRKAGIVNEPFPSMKFKCWENAKPQSFYARDNMENFLKWCRRIGVHEAIIFESDGLVLHQQPRTVVLCLLEIGRIASRFGVEPPGLVKLEKEIEDEYGRGGESEETASNCSSRASSSPILLCRSRTESAMSYGSNGTSRARAPSAGSSPRSSPRSSPSRNGSSGSGTPPATSELDKKVMHVAKSVCEDTSRIKRISEGRYKIAGKTVYIRLLKGRHVMVRVGGGWDTLEHYLTRHEPCQVNVVSRRQSFNESTKVKTPLSSRQSYPGPNLANSRPVSASAIMSSLSSAMENQIPTPKSNGVHRRASSGALISSATRGVSPDSYLQIRSKYRAKTPELNGGGVSTNGKSSVSHGGAIMKTTNGGVYSSFRGTSSTAGNKSSALSRQMSSPINGSSITKTVRVSTAALHTAGNLRPSISRRPSSAQITTGPRKSS